MRSAPAAGSTLRVRTVVLFLIALVIGCMITWQIMLTAGGAPRAPELVGWSTKISRSDQELCEQIASERFTSRARAETLLARWAELMCDGPPPQTTAANRGAVTAGPTTGAAGGATGASKGAATGAGVGAGADNGAAPDEHVHEHEHEHEHQPNGGQVGEQAGDHEHDDRIRVDHIHGDGHFHKGVGGDDAAGAPGSALNVGAAAKWLARKAPAPAVGATVSRKSDGGVDVSYTVIMTTDLGSIAVTGAEPWVGIGVSVTTRSLSPASLTDLSLFKLMLPSLVKTAESGYRFRVVMVYDVGDAFFETSGRVDDIAAWFAEHVRTPLGAKGIQAEMTIVSYANSYRKPGPAFNAMMRAAYDFGADFMYRINDDTEFLDPFARSFASILEDYGVPFGVTGPTCDQGNTRILTHDFVSRLHLEIFDTYYPHVLMDWWMDDWSSMAYGARRTLRADVHVTHHTKSHGTRYTVDFTNAGKLQGEVQAAKKRIADWMRAHELDEAVIAQFEADNFSSPGLGREEHVVPMAQRVTFCKELQARTGIRPNETWGNANPHEQVAWAENECDFHV